MFSSLKQFAGRGVRFANGQSAFLATTKHEDR
jgi:hypothetical protein